MFFFTFIILWSPIVSRYFHFATIYDNPIFRIVEFSVGILLAVLLKSSLIRCSWICNKCVLIFAVLYLVITTSMVSKSGFAKGDYKLYNWIVLPAFMVMFIPLTTIKFDFLANSRVLKYACKISFAFFLAQYYTWRICKLLFGQMGWDSNLLRITISFIVSVLISVLLHECIEKPISNLLRKKLLERDNRLHRWSETLQFDTASLFK